MDVVGVFTRLYLALIGYQQGLDVKKTPLTEGISARDSFG